MRSLLLLITVLALALPVASSAQDAMFDNVPGFQSYEQGMRDYHNGRYFSARHYFLVAARYGDKVAQFNLGVIYYRGDGVPADPARAWAWFHLAAERGYPQMVETAADVWDELGEGQRIAAEDYRAELGDRFADEIVVPRVARMMERARRGATGSRLGAIGMLTVYTRDGASMRGDKFYASERWDYNEIIRIEGELFERLARGRVDIGDIQRAEDDER